MPERWYWLSHAPVKVTYEDEQQLRGLTAILGELRQEPAAAPSFVCAFERDQGYQPPPEAVLMHEGPLAQGIDVPTRMYVAPDREWLFAEPHGSVAIDWKTNRAVIRLIDGGQSLVQSSLGLYALEAAIAPSDQLILHGAGLKLPSRDAAVLIFAPSGYGKTTASLAVALEGFALLTDDVVVLKSLNGHLSTWGLPRSMKVHWRTLELLPALGPVLGDKWDSNGEQELTRENFARIGPVAPPVDYAIEAVLLVGERTDGPHKIVPMPKTEALILLANDNLGRSKIGVPPRHVRKMEALAKLLNQVPAAQLHVGRPLGSLAEAIGDYLTAPARV